jgi:hypothetical protein
VRKAALVLLFLAGPLFCVSAYRMMYAEEYYQLYHEHLHHYPDDTLEDIYYLKMALQLDFANPDYALAPIRDTTHWERYRYLFSMHVNLKLAMAYMTLGVKFEKQDAFFYNYPWKRQNLDSLNIAESQYQAAYAYWAKAREWSAKAWAMRTVQLEKIEEWEDECFRIETGDLDYKDTIDRQLAHLAKVRADFTAMGPGTY